MSAPPGESFGQCNAGRNTIAIYVFQKEDAYARLQEVDALSTSDTPRIFWVYGDNWFTATSNDRLRDRVREALGGEATDNSRI